MQYYIISFKSIFIDYLAFLFRHSNSEQDINLTGFHYSRSSNEILDMLGSKKSVHFLMLNISKISRRFLCKFGMISPKYTIHRSNIKPIPCWAKIFA